MALTELISDYSADSLNTTTATQTEMDKDAFLNLLVTQLQYQDPLEPMKNEEFVAQLAQFNSLEQMINLNDSFSQSLMVQQMAQATSLLGQPVAYYTEDGEATSGIAISVAMDEGEALLQIGNDYVPLGDIIMLGQTTSSSVLAQSSYLIGKEVSWYDEDGETKLSGIVDSIEIVDGIPTVVATDSDDTEHQLGLSEILAVGAAS